MTDAVRPRATFRDVFGVREFRFLWSSVILSTAGDRLALEIGRASCRERVCLAV